MDGPLILQFSKTFPGGPTIAADLRIETVPPCVTVLFGSSGSGKTTLLRALAGLEKPTSGTIRYGDEVWTDTPLGIDLAPQVRRVGFLFQDYALFPHLTVACNLRFGLRHLSSRAAHARVDELMRRFQIEGLNGRYPHQLSGGQKQRVALARSLAPQPRLLLLDEPLSALDAPTREAIRSDLAEILHTLQIPVILVTHDRSEALALGDRLVVMEGGQVLQHGAVEEVFRQPANQAVARIVGVETVVSGRVEMLKDGMATVAVGATRINATALNLPPEVSKVLVCIRAEDVILLKGTPSAQASPRNQWPGTVQSITLDGPMLRIRLDCGFALSSLLTRQACEELELHPGDAVTALVKAPNVHLVPRS